MRKTTQKLSFRIQTVPDQSVEGGLADHVAGASAEVGNTLVLLMVAQYKLLLGLMEREKVTEIVHHYEGVVVNLQQIVEIRLVLLID